MAFLNEYLSPEQAAAMLRLRAAGCERIRAEHDRL
jgi:hypothetical protein